MNFVFPLSLSLPSQNTSGKLSLHRLLVWSHDTFDQLRLLSSLCSQAGYLNGGALASSLHTFLQYGDPNVHQLVKKVISHNIAWFSILIFYVRLMMFKIRLNQFNAFPPSTLISITYIFYLNLLTLLQTTE